MKLNKNKEKKAWTENNTKNNINENLYNEIILVANNNKNKNEIINIDDGWKRNQPPVTNNHKLFKKNVTSNKYHEVKKDTLHFIKNKKALSRINKTSDVLFKINLILFLFMFLLYLMVYYTGGGLWGCFFLIFFLFYKFYYYLFLIIVPVNIVLIVLSERKWYIKIILILLHILFFAGVMQLYTFLFPFD